MCLNSLGTALIVDFKTIGQIRDMESTGHTQCMNGRIIKEKYAWELYSEQYKLT
jgi:hypothetical protein